MADATAETNRAFRLVMIGNVTRFGGTCFGLPGLISQKWLDPASTFALTPDIFDYA
jgi:hypothetical protein